MIKFILTTLAATIISFIVFRTLTYIKELKQEKEMLRMLYYKALEKDRNRKVG